MAKTEKAADAAEPEVSTAEELTLNEFCTRLSITDRRVELIGGFHRAETLAGKVKDTEDAFSARFVEFCNAPA